MMRTSSAVLPEHEQQLKDKGFETRWLDDTSRLDFYRRVGDPNRYPKYMQRVTRQKFGSGWFAQLIMQWNAAYEWRTCWIAGENGTGEPMIFDDPIAAFVFAEIGGWGAAQ